jgi:hypothetical protein
MVLPTDTPSQIAHVATLPGHAGCVSRVAIADVPALATTIKQPIVAAWIKASFMLIFISGFSCARTTSLRGIR